MFRAGPGCAILQDKSRDGVDEIICILKFVRRWRYQRNYTPASKNNIHIPTMGTMGTTVLNSVRNKEDKKMSTEV